MCFCEHIFSYNTDIQSMVETDPLPVGVADSIMSHQRDRKTAVKTNLKVQVSLYILIQCNKQIVSLELKGIY